MTPRPLLPRWLRSGWPELLLLAVGLYFFTRQLGAFPDAWEDDSLFMIVARNVAEGRGYTLPVLHDQWAYPYILAVGPTIIEPAALFIRVFGFSVAVARIPSVLFLLLATFAVYAYTTKIAGALAARWTTALLISLSAFVNTGKPLLGEIPAFFFLMGGFLVLDRGRSSWKWAAFAGLCFGLSVVTKLTFGILFPALAIAWLFLLARRDWHDLQRLTIVGLVAGAIFLLATPVLGYWDPGFLGELTQYGLADGGAETLQVLRVQPELLLRLPYLYFAATLALGLLGLWRARSRLSRAHAVTLLTFVALFMLFFLNSRGWYRLLLPAHLLLLPFVPIGAYALFKKYLGVAVLAFFITAQGYWQFTHMGARLSPEAIDAARILEEAYGERDILLTPPELYVRVMQNPHRFFLSNEFALRNGSRFAAVPLKPEQHCLPILQKMNADEEDSARAAHAELTPVHRRYMLVEPPAACKK